MRFVLGLKSIACLPLVSAQGRVLGVLRLGFQVPWEWTDPEKVSPRHTSHSAVFSSQPYAHADVLAVTNQIDSSCVCDATVCCRVMLCHVPRRT